MVGLTKYISRAMVYKRIAALRYVSAQEMRIHTGELPFACNTCDNKARGKKPLDMVLKEKTPSCWHWRKYLHMVLKKKHFYIGIGNFILAQTLSFWSPVWNIILLKIIKEILLKILHHRNSSNGLSGATFFVVVFIVRIGQVSSM